MTLAHIRISVILLDVLPELGTDPSQVTILLSLSLRSFRLLRSLQRPLDVLNILFASLGSDDNFAQREETYAFGLQLAEWKDPLSLCEAIVCLSNAVPDDSHDTLQKAEAIEHTNKPLLMATETLKLIFFHLSNKMSDGSPTCDKLVLHLVEAISRSNPEMMSNILSGRCASTDAIKEAVYGSAIRQKSYMIVSRLLDSGVDPCLPISRYWVCNRACPRPKCRWGCMLISERGMMKLYARDKRTSLSCGMQDAAFSCDTRLARLLFNARAGAKDAGLFLRQQVSLLEIVALAGGYASGFDGAMDFAQLLIKHNLLASCGRKALVSAIGISIARGNNRLAKFLIEEGASIILPEDVSRGYGHMSLHSHKLKSTGINLTPLHGAIVSENAEMVKSLLQPFLSHSTQMSAQDIKHLLITSCLAGDADTTIRVLTQHPNILDGWNQGITPLVATAWNQDNTVAEVLLDLGACVGRTLKDRILNVSIPAPIHIAAWHGNTDLVQRLVDFDADFNVRYIWDDNFLLKGLNITKGRTLSPLQMTLQNGNPDTARALIPLSNLLGDELIKAVELDDSSLISDIVSKDPDNIDSTDELGRTVLQIAIKAANTTFIPLYFSLGGSYHSRALYVAVDAAIKSKGYSIVHLLATYRPIGGIDHNEASSLVLSIDAREWDLAFLLLQDPFLPSLSRSFRSWPEALYTSGRIDFMGKEPLWNRPPSDMNSYGEKARHVFDKSPLSSALLSENQALIGNMIQRGYTFQSCDVQTMQYVADDTRQAVLSHFPLETMDLLCRRVFLLYAIFSRDVRRIVQHMNLLDSLDFECWSRCSFCDGRSLLDTTFPLELAVGVGSTETILLILDAGANIDFNVCERTALFEAVLWERLDAVALLLDRGASIGGCAEHILYPAIRAKNLEMITLLLDHGVSIDPPVQSERGETALQYSVESGRLDIARLLLSRGADVNALPAKECGNTALEFAARYGRLDMIHLLLEMGAKLDGEMRIYYVRSVGFADPRKYSSQGCDLSSIETSSDSSEELSVLDYEAEQAEHVEDEGGRLRSPSYAIYSMPQPPQNNIISLRTEPSELNFADNRTVEFGLNSSQILACQRVIELDETMQDSNLAQSTAGDSNMSPNMTSFSGIDSPEVLEQGAFSTEEIPGLGPNTYILEADIQGEQSNMARAGEVGWGGPFSNATSNELEFWFGEYPYCL
ncbi:ankyrin repeat-containing domain protein [Nemania abortiva]|nr:ankyrin repeat-containing domain protein [Nemania abortiva]